MTKYLIKRWDVVQFNGSIRRYPVVYIEPDDTFMSFIEANNNAVMVEISNTGKMYDCEQIPGVAYKSCNIPNYRPNFYNKTGWWCIVLTSQWRGYPTPENMGTLQLFGLNPVPSSLSEQTNGNGNDNGNNIIEKKDKSLYEYILYDLNNYLIIGTLVLMAIIIISTIKK